MILRLIFILCWIASVAALLTGSTESALLALAGAGVALVGMRVGR